MVPPRLAANCAAMIRLICLVPRFRCLAWPSAGLRFGFSQNAPLDCGKGSAKDERLWQLFDAHWEYQMNRRRVCNLAGYPGQNGRWSDLVEGD